MSSLEKFPTCAAACAFVGIDEPNQIRLGGWVRSDDLASGKRGRSDGAVYFFPEGHGGIAVNNRRPDMDPAKKALFFYDCGQDGRKLTKQELRARKERADKALADFLAGKVRKARAVAWIARELTGMLKPASGNAHPYLVNKRISTAPGVPRAVLLKDDLRGLLDNLPQSVFTAIYADEGGIVQPVPALPIQAARSYLWVPLTGAASPLPLSAQLITDRADLPRNKAFLRGTQKYLYKRGKSYGLLWAPDDLPFSCTDALEIGLAEGLATAVSARRLRGYPVCAGLDCGNLQHAARTLRYRYPNARIHLLADRDANGAGQSGAMAALEQLAVGRLRPNADMEICPELDAATLARFREWKGKPDAMATDFNDYEIAIGL